MFHSIKDFAVYQAFSHDAIIFFFIIIFFYLSYLSRLLIISIILRTFVLILYGIYTADFYIWLNYATHITLHDLYKFINYIPSFINQNYEFNIFLLLSIISLIIILIYFIIKQYSINNKKIHFLTITSLSVLLLVNLNADTKFYIHSWIYKNVFEYNNELKSKSNPYSNDFINSFNYNKQNKYKEIKSNKRNIVLLMVESLSSYHSNLFSGLNNWTPNLDSIAKNNVYFKNFYANGFITEHAEISLLTGDLPLTPPAFFSKYGSTSFNPFFNISHSLPHILKTKNYQTEFITSSDLNFSNTELWAKSIGFDYIEGSRHPDYKGLTRYHFEAPEDKYLYKRVLSRLKDNQDNPHFLFIKTVSSHVPFVNPENMKFSEEETIKYVDKQIGNFYKELIARNYFKNDGILIIVGDHHPTAPVKEKALKKFGAFKATAKVPAIIISKEQYSMQVDEQFQQIDLYNTILSHTSNKFYTNKWKGYFHSPEQYASADYIVHKRPDQKAMLSIFNNKHIYNVLLDGDNTKILNNDTKEHLKKEIINKINSERIKDVTKNTIKLEIIKDTYFPRSVLLNKE